MKHLFTFLIFSFFIFSAHATIWTVDSLNNAGYGSLRAAIDSSSNGDTVRFSPLLIVNGSDSIVLGYNLSFNKSLTIIGLYTTTDTLFISGNNGSAIFLKTSYQGTQSRMVLDSMVLINGGGYYSNGGAIYSSTSDSIFISNSVIRNCNITGNGGGIYSGAAPTTLINTIIEGNNAEYGGGIYATTPLFIDGCQINGNIVSEDGGGIYAKDTVRIYNSTISYNEGFYGGALRLDGHNVKFLAENSSINYNQAGEGGAIHVGYIGGFSSEDTSSVFTLTHTDMIGNMGAYGGGVIKAQCAQLEFNAQNCRFNQNHSIDTSATYATGDAMIRMENLWGSFFNGYQQHVIFIADSCEFNNNRSVRSAIHLIAKDSNIYSLSNCSIDSNLSLSQGITGVKLTGGDSASQIIVDNCTVNQNNLIDSTVTYVGGGMEIESDTGSLLITNSQFNDNYGGPGLLLTGHYDNLEIQNNSFDRNTFKYGKGGGLHITLTDQDSVRIENCSISGNIQNHTDWSYSGGGGLFVLAKSLIIENSDISNNSTIGIGHGGGILVSGVSDFNLSIINSTIDNNSTNWNGGSIYVQVLDSATFDFNLSSFNGNSAYTGGGIYLHVNRPNDNISASLVASMNHCSVNDNSASNQGGILIYANASYYNSTAIFDIEQSTINGNNALYGNGGISVIANNSTSIANLSIKSSTISNSNSNSNATISVSGIQGQLDLINSTIINNHSNNNWSTIEPSGANIFVKGCIFSQNDTIDFRHIFNGTFVSGGYNIYENTNLPNVHATDVIGVDSISLNLGPISNNGGPTLTMLPLYPSVALNSGNPSDTSMAQNGPIYGVREVGAAESCISTITDVQYACDSLTWIDGITYFSNTDTAHLTFVNAIGCDSIITLNLTITTDYVTDTVFTCGLASYTWIDSITYYSNNFTAVDTLINSWGCDSIVSLYLIMGDSQSSTDSINLCDQTAYAWINGSYYYSNNSTATTTLQTVAGCDSVVTLNLTFNFTSYSIDTVITCNSMYTWIDGISYTSNVFGPKDTVMNSVGCDSIITLYLIFNSNSSIDSVTTCNTSSYTWMNGVTYTSNNNTASDTLTNSLGCDSIVYLNLTMNYPTYGIDTIIACDSLTWLDGVTYTSNNYSAIDTILNSVGCDSIVTLNLTIVYPTTGVDTIVTCDSHLWIDGLTYYGNNNTATHVLTTSFGCDSVVTLNLTINNYRVVDTVYACLFYTWMNGVVYVSNNNTATHILTNASGCDTIVTLNLTINTPSIGVDSQIVCDSLTWLDGITYTSSNNSAIHVISGGNANGCDSIVTLNLTVGSSTTIDIITACDSFTWMDGNTYTSNNTTATDTLVATNGCDSIIVLDLTITNSTNAIDTQISCYSYTWIDSITYTASNNTAIYIVSNSFGCDSIITLNLTITNSTSFVDVQTACGTYTWINGITYTSNNNTATNILVNAFGCDSIVSLNLTIINVDTSVVEQSLTLTSQATNASYQWIDCNTNNPILNETNALFVVTQSGDYAVEVTQNGCVDTSSCYSFINVGINDVESADNIEIYPNPTSSQLNIETQNFKITKIQILDNSGKLVKTITSNFEIVNVASLATGVYHLELIGEEETVSKKFIKQ